jgi:hypothetical protein
MTTQEKRKHARVSSLNLSYVCLDEKDKIVKQGMGRTLNVSESGILLETHFPIDQSHTVTLTLGLEEELVDIKGRPVHTRTNDAGNTRWASSFLNLIKKPAGLSKNLSMLLEKKAQKTNDLIKLKNFCSYFSPTP